MFRNRKPVTLPTQPVLPEISLEEYLAKQAGETHVVLDRTGAVVAGASSHHEALSVVTAKYRADRAMGPFMCRPIRSA